MRLPAIAVLESNSRLKHALIQDPTPPIDLSLKPAMFRSRIAPTVRFPRSFSAYQWHKTRASNLERGIKTKKHSDEPDLDHIPRIVVNIHKFNKDSLDDFSGGFGGERGAESGSGAESVHDNEGANVEDRKDKQPGFMSFKFTTGDGESGRAPPLSFFLPPVDEKFIPEDWKVLPLGEEGGLVFARPHPITNVLELKCQLPQGAVPADVLRMQDAEKWFNPPTVESVENYFNVTYKKIQENGGFFKGFEF